MTVQRMHHVGVVVEDLDAAIAFLAALGMRGQAATTVEGELVDRITAVPGNRSRVAMLKTPDGHGRVELIEFLAPDVRMGDVGAPANTLGLRHLAFVVDDLDATLDALLPHGGRLVGDVARLGTTYRLCYVRGPAGIIVELAETVG